MIIAPDHRAGIVGQTDPSIGYGVVVFHDEAGEAVHKIELASAPWRERADQPFRWDFVPALGGPRSCPEIHIAAARHVDIKTSPSLMGWRFLGPREPLLRIYRPQSVHGLQADGSFDAHALVPSPQLWAWAYPQRALSPGYEPESSQAKVCMVRHSESAVDIVDIASRFRVTIRASPWEPSAFAYQLVETDLPEDALALVIVATKNISFRTPSPNYAGIFVSRRRDLIDPSTTLRIFVALTSSIDAVPPQGADLTKSGLPFLPLGDEFIRPVDTRRMAWAQFAFDIAVSFLPIVGAMYDVTQVLHGALDHGEGADVGYVLAIGATMGAAGVLRASRTARLDALVRNETAMAKVLETADPDTLTAIRAMDPGESRRLGEKLDLFFARKVTARELLKHLPASLWRSLANTRTAPRLRSLVGRETFDDVYQSLEMLPHSERLKVLDNLSRSLRSTVEHLNPTASAAFVRVTVFEQLAKIDFDAAQRFEQAQLRRLVLRVLDDDLSAFRNQELRELFFASRGTHKATPRETIEWATRSRRTDRKHAVFEREIGPEYKEILRRVVGSDGPLRPLDQQARTHFNTIAARGLDYGTHAEVTAANRGFGWAYESDHLLEQRFFFDLSETHRDEWITRLVPKDPHLRQQMSGYSGWDHRTKTIELRELIPIGAEEQYTVQQIWDAHVWVYRKLAPDDWRPAVSRLAEMFEEIAGAPGADGKWVPRTNQRAEWFLPSAWPKWLITWLT